VIGSAIEPHLSWKWWAIASTAKNQRTGGEEAEEWRTFELLEAYGGAADRGFRFKI
jgi:hypothetical protein